MHNIKYEVYAPLLDEYDVAVCGGGISGFSAAVSAARSGMKVVILENGGYMGGTMTQSLVLHFIDCANKGGIVREMLSFLNQHDMTCPRAGKRVDENGKKHHGYLLDLEGVKCFFDKTCSNLGIEVLYYSRVIQAEVENDNINHILIASDSGNYAIKAKQYIDATGNGNLAALAGCDYESGEPGSGTLQAMSMPMIIAGYPESFDSIDSEDGKTKYNSMMEENGIETSAGQFALAKLPSLQSWAANCNFEFNVRFDDIRGISKATVQGRLEDIETIMKHAKIKGYEKMFLDKTGDHIGVREGRRIFGKYRITLDDIIEGKRFEDGICLVKFIVDVHKLKQDDTLDNKRGIKIKPYNIPYCSLVPLQCDNLLLAGRCISGDFYPHASYRVMGNMAATGEAAGYAASICVKNKISPAEVDGKSVSEYMCKLGYEI